MADIIFAEFDGTSYLVAGVEHLDDLLANYADFGERIEFVACASMDEVEAIHRYHCGEDAAARSAPWAVHPNIIRRLKGLGLGIPIIFAKWSALVDAAAQRNLDRAVSLAKAAPDDRVRLNGQSDPADPMTASILQMRHQMLTQALVDAGIDATRIERVTRSPGTPGYHAESTDVIDIEIAKADDGTSLFQRSE